MTSPIYTLNDSYFDQIDTEVKAYFLGLLYADGCNYEDIGRIKIDLIESDGYILERLKEELEYKGIITNYPAQTKIIDGKPYECQASCRLNFISKHMSKILASYGVVSHKSECGEYIKPGIVPNNLFHHWVRGMIDGNGGIAYWIDNENTGHKKFQIHFCGTVDIVNKLADFFANKFSCKPAITDRYPDRKNNNLQFSICGNQLVRKILDWLYKNATIYLLRKYDKYQDLILENERATNNKTLYGSMKQRRQVIHIPTGKIYESLAAAEKDTGTNKSSICVQAKRNNGRWAYYDESFTKLVK